MGAAVIHTVVRKKFVYRRWLPSLASLLAGLAFVDVHLGGLVLVGLLPFIHYVLRARSLSTKQILFDCWLAAFVFALVVGSWVLQTEPGTWVSLSGSVSVIARTAVWLFAALFASLAFGLIMGLFVARLRHRVALLLVLLPVAWALAELARSYSVAVFTLGPGSSLSPNWNFGSLGLAVASTPLVYISRFAGLHGLTMVAVALNISIYLFWLKRRRLALVVLAIILVINVAAWRVYSAGHGRAIKVTAVNLQPKNGSLKDWSGPPLPSKDTTLLVLPEHAHFFENPSQRQFVAENLGTDTVIITSERGSGLPPTNDLVYYSARKGFIATQPKTFLAPYGEYMPYVTAQALRANGKQSVLDTFQRHSQIGKGPLQEHPVRANGVTIGGLVCSGVLSLSQYRQLTREGADILTNSASLGLLDNAGMYHVQEYYQNRFHAVANAKPFVQATRSGEAYIISSDGKVLVRTKQTGLIETMVNLQSKRTLYSLL